MNFSLKQRISALYKPSGNCITAAKANTFESDIVVTLFSWSVGINSVSLCQPCKDNECLTKTLELNEAEMNRKKDPVREELARAGEASQITPSLRKLDGRRIMTDTDVPEEDFLILAVEKRVVCTTLNKGGQVVVISPPS